MNSQARGETQGLNASHAPDETQYHYASHPGHENQSRLASHPMHETQSGFASQRPDETRAIDASQRAIETHLAYASQNYDETQPPDARKETEMTDKRPDPKPRKNAHLWQTYLIYSELEWLGVKHANRRASIKAEKSNFDLGIEEMFLVDSNLDKMKADYLKAMSAFASNIPAFDWLTSLKGIGDGLACKLLAQIDDIGKFATVSKLWRYSGYAVIDGHREYNTDGEKSHYNKRLKSTCFLVVESFIKQQTPVYADIYYAEKIRLRELYPEKIVTNGKTKYNDGHLHAMAMRKTAKIFLQHLWLVWRTLEGLPVTDPYIHDIGGHSHIIPPPNFEPVTV